MKKNKFLKVAGAVFTMCLITTCAIGTTFAKYTTGSSASDTARVAKWGVEVSASGTMFGTAYQDTIVSDGKTEATVQSNHNISYAANVVAPGTMNNTGIQIKVEGQPEVEFTVKAEVTTAASDISLNKGTYGVMVKAEGVNYATNFAGEKIYYYDGAKYVAATLTYYEANPTATYYKLTDKATVNTEKYLPIVWDAKVTVDGTPYTATFDTLEESLAALVNGINDYDGTTTVGYAQYDPNTSVSLVYHLTWAWAFDGNDAADTILGNLMAKAQGTFSTTSVIVKLDGTDYVEIESTDYNLTVGCGFSVTATQVN